MCHQPFAICRLLLVLPVTRILNVDTFTSLVPIPPSSCAHQHDPPCHSSNVQQSSIFSMPLRGLTVGHGRDLPSLPRSQVKSVFVLVAPKICHLNHPQHPLLSLSSLLPILSSSTSLFSLPRCGGQALPTFLNAQRQRFSPVLRILAHQLIARVHECRTAQSQGCSSFGF